MGLYSRKSLLGAWVTDMVLDDSKLDARGKWATQYGLAFQKYVDEKLMESKLIVTNLGSRKISAHEYPEIRPWLDSLQQKEGFEIDRLIKYGKTIFVGPCKTSDFLYDRKVVRRDVIFSKKELERRVTKNLQDVSEIQVITDCIRCCGKMQRKL